VTCGQTSVCCRTVTNTAQLCHFLLAKYRAFSIVGSVAAFSHPGSILTFWLHFLHSGSFAIRTSHPGSWGTHNWIPHRPKAEYQHLQIGAEPVVKCSRNGVLPPVSSVLPPTVVVPPPGNDVPLPFEGKSLKSLPPEVRFQGLNAPNTISAGAPSQTPLGEITAVAQNP